MSADPIQLYHDLLTPALAAESHERLAEQQRRRGLGFGDKPLCNVLRPRLLTVEQYRFIRRAVAPLMGASATIHEAAVKDDAFRRQFRLTPEENELFRIVPGYPCPMPTARLDAFFVPGADGGGVLRFTEINAETPAAAAYTDELADVFLNLPIMAAFQRHYNAVLQPARPGSLNSLLECWQAWGGEGAPACRHPRLEGGADVPRVRPVGGVHGPPGDRGPHHRPARGGVLRRTAAPRRFRHRSHLQACADQ